MSDIRESKEKVDVEKAIEILSSYTNNYFGDKLHGGQVGVVDIIELLKEQEEKICSAREIAMDESKNATWREDYEAWEVLDRIVQKLS